jgi:hypothetical protein
MQISVRLRKQQTTSRAIVIVASLSSLGALLLPWTREGSTERNAYSLGRALNETGLMTNMAERWLYDAVIAIPVTVGVVCAATLLRRDGFAAISATVVGAIELLASVAVIAKVRESVEIGPWLSVFVGGIATSSWPLWRMTREHNRV